MAMCLCTPSVPLWRAQGQLSLSPSAFPLQGVGRRLFK
jgi:hypothetical protein